MSFIISKIKVYTIAGLLTATGLAFANCGPAYNNKDAKSMISALNRAVGGSAGLMRLKDVQFTYNYDQISKGVKDVSVEKYIFAGEFSRADYSTHQVHVAPNLEGPVTQVFDGKTPVFAHKGKKLNDPKLLGVTHFLRKANFFWFTMMFKLGDAGTIYEILPQRTVNGKTYDIVKVTYDTGVTGKKQNDIFILYINPRTHLVDQFLFSLPAFKVMKPVLLFEVEYKDMNGIKIISKRTMYGTKDGKKVGKAQLIQTIRNVKFNNGFTAKSLSL